MHRIILVLACLACSGDASSRLTRNRRSGESDASQALASLLATLNPRTAFRPSATGHSAVVAAPAGRVHTSPALRLSTAGNLDRRLLLLQACAAVGTCVLQPRQASAISATTMTGKSKPELGVILADAPTQTGTTISGELLLRGGLIAEVKFDSPWTMATGGYYDMEASPSKVGSTGDLAFVAVRKLPTGESLSTLPRSWFEKALLDVNGRYGSYGSPTDVKWKGAGEPSDSERNLQVSFTILTPNNAEVTRTGVVKALKAEGSDDVIMLMSSTTQGRWKEGGDQLLRQVQKSFRIASTRKTNLEAIRSNDYRDVAKDVTRKSATVVAEESA